MIYWPDHPDWVNYAHGLWNQEPQLSTARIAVECSSAWHIIVTKNTIVGRASAYGWTRRPSPIRPRAAGTDPKPRNECLPPGGNRFVGGSTLKELPCLRDQPPPAPERTVSKEPAKIAHRDPAAPLYRRDGSGCLAVGCGSPLYSVLKPYCSDCAALYYLKTSRMRKEDRDERDFY